MIKSIALATAVVLMAAGTAVAAPKHNRGHGNVNGWERVQIAKSAAHLAQLKRRAYADGRVTFFERIRIRRAEAQHSALVRRAWRS